MPSVCRTKCGRPWVNVGLGSSLISRVLLYTAAPRQMNQATKQPSLVVAISRLLGLGSLLTGPLFVAGSVTAERDGEDRAKSQLIQIARELAANRDGDGAAFF